MKAIEVLENLPASSESTVDVKALKEKCYEAMNDDLNSPILIAHLFDGVKMINSINDGKEKISAADLAELQKLYHDFAFDILGLQSEEQATTGGDEDTMTHVVDLLLNLRVEAKKNKDWATADKIRNELSALGFEIKDTKDGFSWDLKK